MPSEREQPAPLPTAATADGPPTASTADGPSEAEWEAGAVPERVGPYVVLGELARGGMGIVYTARDERLGRRVALKALPESLAHDALRRARLEREARLLALVSHPGVATIHGLEEAGGRTFLVLEFVEGETLHERLERGALDLREAISTCARIAEAVEAAHERGVVHRDLKPANVKVTPEGVVKVLDFGLAKGLHDADEPLATVVELDDGAGQDVTRDGSVLGTVGYMAPEHLRGDTIDRRADAWALGCILFECLSGRSPWAWTTQREWMQAVRFADPDWTQLPGATPDAVRRVLAACLEKDLPRRLSRVGDLREVLQEELDRLDGRVVVQRAGNGARVGNLPRQLTSFLGREATRDDVTQRVRAGGLVTLLGPGGTGKTRLALEVAREVGAELEGGSWFVDLAPVKASGDDARGGAVLAAIASALGVVEGGGRGLREQVEAHLTARETLVVLDNCEHVVDEASAVAAGLLEACPELRVVATSREALQVEGEQVVSVEPLGVPAAGAAASVEEALQHDAVRLYVERARRGEALRADGVERRAGERSLPPAGRPAARDRAGGGAGAEPAAGAPGQAPA